MRKKLDLIIIINYTLKSLAKGFDFKTSLEITAKELKFDKDQMEIINKEILNDGINSLIIQINHILNQRMNQGKPRNFLNLRINEKIRYLILKRLKMIDNLFDRKLILNIAFKQKSPFKLIRMLFNISDEIWHISGDTSTDFNFYSKRIILMNIYTASFFYFLRDSSLDLSKTKIFIDKQIDSVLKFGKFKSKFSNIFYSKKI